MLELVVLVELIPAVMSARRAPGQPQQRVTPALAKAGTALRSVEHRVRLPAQRGQPHPVLEGRRIVVALERPPPCLRAALS
jgi:hypothetical protein